MLRVVVGSGVAKRYSAPAVGIAVLALAAAGCGGGSKAPSVASLGTTGSTTTSSSGGSGNGAGSGNATASFVKFANCMNRHGVKASVPAGGHGISVSPGTASPAQMQAAQKACQKLLPGGGPQALSPAQKAEMIKAELALAKCMRTHGYPSFPDPGSDGSLDLKQTGAFDPTSSQFQSAMQACRPKGGKGKFRIGIQVQVPAP